MCLFPFQIRQAYYVAPQSTDNGAAELKDLCLAVAEIVTHGQEPILILDLLSDPKRGGAEPLISAFVYIALFDF